MKVTILGFLVWSVMLMAVANLHAAVTDADLGKVTQLIQEGKTEGAKAEITILLDHNPNDPNAPKLKKILDSLGTSVNRQTNAMPSTHQIDGPAEQETLKWIQSHIAQLNSSVRCSLTNWSGDTASSMLELSISSIYLENGQLTVVVAEGYYVGSIPSLNLSSGRSSSTKYTIAIADLDGGVEINRSETSGRDCTCSPSICQELWFFSKPNKVVEISTSIYESVGGKVKLDGTEIDSALQNPADEVKRRAINGQGKQSTGSAFIIPVNPEMAERFKKAFDRLIQLHSDDKPEAF